MNKIFISLLIAISLTGCASVSKQAFNKENSKHIKTLTLAKQEAPESYGINIVAHPAANFGLVGGLIAVADLESKGSILTKALDPKSTKLREQLSLKLNEALNKAGYSIEVVAHTEEKEPTAMIAGLRSKSKTDVILATNINASYIAAGPTTPYYPYVRADVALADIQSGKILYQDTITYGYAFPNSKTIHLGTGSDFQFENIDKLVEQKDKARAGLAAGIEAIINQVTFDLAKN